MTHSKNKFQDTIKLKKQPPYVLTVLLTLCLFVLLIPKLSAETQVSIRASETLATIGQHIGLKIIVKTTSEIDNIKLKVEKKEFEILDQKYTEKRKQQDYTVFEKDIQLAFFKTGDFNIGPFDIALIKGEKIIETRETNSIPVTVKTVLEEEDKDIKALKGLVDIKGDPFYILKYVILALVIIGIIIYIISRIKRNKNARVEIEPELSPLEELETRINELSAQKLYQQGKAKLLFIQLTLILKNFLHRNYSFNAEDFTTFETNFQLKRRERDTLVLNHMQFLFNTADLVKFAKFMPDTAVLEEIWKKCGELILFYKERIRVQELEKAQAQARTQAKAETGKEKTT
ncbi:MAG: hypothetical protein GY757_04050 [bacterium]|nr:hypothetical protein [bacterium]